jgi:outer membrane protein OmpA-like peptidoglycan-associated protein
MLLALIMLFLVLTESNHARTTEDSLDAPAKWRKKMIEFQSSSNSYLKSNIRYGIRYGLWGEFDYNLNMANFREIAAGYLSCCPEEYGLSATAGYSLGGAVDYYFNKNIGISILAGYRNYSSELKKDEIFPYSFDGIKKEGTIVHSLDADLTSISITPLIRYRLFSGLDILGGISMDYVLTNNFTQRESLEIDDPYVFSNDSTVRNFRSGEIPNANSLLFGLTGGISMEMPVNKSGTWIFEPSLIFNYSVNTIAMDLDWTMGAAKINFALKYSPSPTIDTIDYEQKQQRRWADSVSIVNNLTKAINDSTIAALNVKKNDIDEIIDKNVLIARITDIVYRDGNQEKELKKLYIEEKRRKRCVPLLNYIFFDKGSYEIPDRYNKISDTKRLNFNEEKLIFTPTLNIYYNILNIIGRRMNDNPSAKITLTGCNDNTDSEEGNLTLSRRRAEKVSYYLQNVWKIPSSRIEIESRNLPQQYTKSINREGIEENRRVEISSDNRAILRPICLDYVYKDVTPDGFATKLNIVSGAGIADWYLKMEDYYGMESKVGMQGDTVPDIIEWNLQDNYHLIPTDKGEILLTLYAQDQNNLSVNTMESFAVEYQTLEAKKDMGIKDTLVEDYSVLLPFDDPYPDQIGRRTLAIAEESLNNKPDKFEKAIITGYTDILGNEQKNIDLARARAEITKKMFNVSDIIAKTRSLSNKYDNDLPEGRFYNRSADIELYYLIR